MMSAGLPGASRGIAKLRVTATHSTSAYWPSRGSHDLPAFVIRPLLLRGAGEGRRPAVSGRAVVLLFCVSVVRAGHGGAGQCWWCSEAGGSVAEVSSA